MRKNLACRERDSGVRHIGSSNFGGITLKIAIVTQRVKCLFSTLVGSKAVDNLLIAVVARIAATNTLRHRVECRKLEIAIRSAAPAPIEVEEIVAAIAIAHKCVTCTAVIAGIEYRASIRYLVINQVVPFVDRIKHSFGIFQRFIVVEITNQRSISIRKRCTRRQAITHHSAHTYTIHQRSHSLFLLIGSAGAIHIEHIIPVEIDSRKVER